MNEMASIITNGTFMASRWEESQHQGWGQGAGGVKGDTDTAVQLPSEDLVCARHHVRPSFSSQ